MLQLRRELTDTETAERLLTQARNYGTFALLVGAAPFHFLRRLGLFRFFELVEGDPTTRIGLSSLRIFNYGGPASAECGYEVTWDGKISDSQGDLREPDELLSSSQAQSGWEAHDLVLNYGDLVEQWLEQNRGKEDGK